MRTISIAAIGVLVAASALRLVTLPDAGRAVEEVRTWGPWPWLAIILLLWADLVLPVPQAAAIALSGALYGIVGGAAIGALGLSLCGVTLFALARAPRVRRWAQRRLRNDQREWLAPLNSAAGPVGIALTRSLPYSVAEIVVVIAALTGMRWTTFLVSLTAGTVPAAVLYAAIGAGTASDPVTALIISQVLPLATLPAALRLAGRASSRTPALTDRGGSTALRE